MVSDSVWLLALGPAGLLLTGLVSTSSSKRIFQSARLFGAVSLICAVLALALVGGRAPLEAPLIGIGGLGFSLYLDTLSGAVFALVSFVGLTVLIYSRNYMAGDPGQGRFTKWISMTLGCVLFLIISGNFVQFFMAWVSMSLCLHQLLTYYAERPSAILAARKKWVVSRVGDLLILTSMILLYRELGSLQFTTLFQASQQAHETGVGRDSFVVVAVLFAFAALLKSAQFPVHGWLLEVMETPTPVSALLHAGVINAGGFLLIRFSHLLSLSPLAMNTLIIIGALTALFASLVMLTQTSIKVSLAYSTVAQMGFMMLECGLGVFSAAALHIIAHSVYKAHAFLSSGEAVTGAKLKTWVHRPSRYGPAMAILVATLAALVGVTALGLLVGSTLLTHPGSATLTYIFALGVATLLANGLEGRLTILSLGRILFIVLGVAASFYLIQMGAARVFADSLYPEDQELTPFGLVLRVAVILLFGAVMTLQRVVQNRTDEAWIAFYTHLSNGFYVNTLANRWAIRFWPGAAPRSAEPSYLPVYSQRGPL